LLSSLPRRKRVRLRRPDAEAWMELQVVEAEVACDAEDDAVERAIN
jgi:hypothetical protein